MRPTIRVISSFIIIIIMAFVISYLRASIVNTMDSGDDDAAGALTMFGFILGVVAGAFIPGAVLLSESKDEV